MKKVFLFIISFFIFSFNVSALKQEVTLSKCVDGDTAYFILDSKEIKTRFLAINTPESTNKIEEYGKEASNYTCNLLKNANKIEIEYDDASDKLDKYDRHLVWIFVDNKLLQKEVIKKGYAEIKYIYGDYKYLDELKKEEEIAKKNNLGIWSEYKEDYSNYYLLGALIVIIIVICIFSKSARKKVLNDVENETKKGFKKIKNKAKKELKSILKDSLK